MATRQKSLVVMVAIGLAFALSTTTQLRPAGLPFGISELILLGCMIVHVPLGFGLHGSNPPRYFVAILLGMLLLTVPGFMLTLAESGQVPFTLYGLVASAWIVLLFTYLHYGFDYGRTSFEHVARLFLFFSTVYFWIVLALAYLDPRAVYREDEFVDLPIEQAGTVLDVFEPVYRLVGFANDPNQIALQALVCAFFALQLRRLNGNVVTFVCLASAVVVGVMAKSDSFLFAVIALVGTSIFMSIVFRRAYVLALILIVPTVAFGLINSGRIINEVQEIAQTNDQDKTRVTLWVNGIRAGLQRPLIGLGPGAWSGFEGPGELFESHNTAIEYFSHAGLFGSALFLAGFLAIWWRALLSGQAVLLAGVVALTVFATFHNVLRQPVFWLAVYLIVTELWRDAPARRRQRRKSRASRAALTRGMPV